MTVQGWVWGAVLAAGVTCVVSVPALAQPRPAAPAAPAATPTPDQTTASFGDWILRCVRFAGPPETQSCEIAQSAQADVQVGTGGQIQRQTVMQLAIGREARGAPLRITVVLPVNVQFQPAPVLAPETGEPQVALPWQRCLPAACFASLEVNAALLQRLRAANTQLSVRFQDGGGRDVSLPVSIRGLSSAIDALQR